VPKLWNDTIETHRRAVRDATLDAAAQLVAERGLRAVTMAQIAQTTGIGRATLYKYFPDVDSILVAWHERQIGEHLEQLSSLRDGAGDPSDRLKSVLEAYALMQHEQPASELAAMLHRGDHVARAQEHLRDLVEVLLEQGAAVGVVRQDVSARELATYCLHALTAAGHVPSRAAVRRLVAVTLAGLQPERLASA
jgi:AcrR family transcriptional regulator